MDEADICDRDRTEAFGPAVAILEIGDAAHIAGVGLGLDAGAGLQPFIGDTTERPEVDHRHRVRLRDLPGGGIAAVLDLDARGLMQQPRLVEADTWSGVTIFAERHRLALAVDLPAVVVAPQQRARRGDVEIEPSAIGQLVGFGWRLALLDVGNVLLQNAHFRASPK